MNRCTSKLKSPLGAASLVLALATSASLAGCTIYASGTDEWDEDHPSGTSHQVTRAPRSTIPISLIGRQARVHLHDPDGQIEGTVRELGEWVRLERNGGTMFIPREHVRYIEPVPASTTQP